MRASAAAVACVVLLAGCAGIRGEGDAVDPDLVPLTTEAPPDPIPALPPDEVIGPPDAPGADLIGEDAPANAGPTRHVAIDESPAGSDAVVAQPRREKMPSMMGDLLWGPRNH